MFIKISYDLMKGAPSWPGDPAFSIENVLSIAKGDVANTYLMGLYNHFGSHYDAPQHFLEGGLSICELPLERFIFTHPVLLDIPKSFCEKVTAAELAAHEKKLSECDLLMIRTGFSRYRTEDPEGYSYRGPAVSAEAARYLKDNFPCLKAVALDWISLASYSDMVDGTQAHQILLGGDEEYVCIIEDLDLTALSAESMNAIYAFPLFVRGIDSAPVTVLADVSAN